MRTILTTALALTMALQVGRPVHAQQTDPRTLPLFTGIAAVQPIGTWTYDWPDGAGGDISYGGGAVGLSEDGKFIYISCVQDHAGFAKLTLPAVGGRAKVVAPCLGPNRAEIAKVHPDPSAFRPMLGGILELNGRITVTGYISYDASGSANKSHWHGPDLAHLSGPFAGTVPNGMVKSQMGVVPPEWRALLGGSAYSTAGYTSIISRASYGAAVTIFDPATVTGNGFPMTTVLGCRHNDPGCNTYDNDAGGKDNYQGSELTALGFFVPGSRTYLVVEREGTGPSCYGYATRNKADHGKPYLDAKLCYSLTDPLDQKGPKAYPYRLVAKLYDVNEWVAVKQGTKKPWEIRQYATIDLPGSNDGEYIQSGVFDRFTGQLHLWRYTGGGVNTVYVYGGFPKDGGVVVPPPDANCIPGKTVYTFVSQTACVPDSPGATTGIRKVTESWVRTGDVPATGNGQACEPTTGPDRVRDESCVPPPPPPPMEFNTRFRSFNTSTHRMTLQASDGTPMPAKGATVRVLIGGIPYDATVYDVDLNYYSQDERVIVTIPDLPFLAITVQK
ncbi:MAG: hypothetical protein ACYC2H_01230 [Thermoplasmatota archaeon]